MIRIALFIGYIGAKNQWCNVQQGLWITGMYHLGIQDLGSQIAAKEREGLLYLALFAWSHFESDTDGN